MRAPNPDVVYDWGLGFGEYVVGALVLVLILGAAIVVARDLRMRILPGWAGPPGWLATAVLTVGTLLVSAEVVGLFGLFNRVAYTAFLLALAGATLAIASKRAGRGEDGSDSVEALGPSDRGAGFGGPLVLFAAGAVAAVILARAIWTVVGVYDGGMTGFDTHWYHGPFTALFIQGGETFVLNNSIAPQYLSWFYPHNSELLHAILAVPFARDFLSPGLNLVWLAGSMLAAWCIGRPFGVAPISLIAVGLILGSGLLSDQPGEMRNDIPAVFFVLAAAAIAVNAWTEAAAPTNGGNAARLPGWGALAVVGLASGMAAGTKLNYLATAGALVIALAFALPLGRRLRGFGLLFATASIGGGYWYLRNLVHSGNPLPWITSAGPIDFPGPSQEIGGREAHGVFEYLFDATVWRDWFLPGLREALTLAWPLILLAAAVATIALLVRPLLAMPASHRRGGGNGSLPLGLALALTILATVGAWLVAPASAEGPPGEPVGFVSGLRYLAPALALALALLPAAVRPQLAAMARFLPDNRAEERGRSAVRQPPGRGALGALICVVAGGCLIAGFFLQGYYMERRYAEPDFSTPGLDRAFAEASRAAPKPDGAAPIAVTSTRIYPFFGPDLKQPVAYVGIAEPQGGFRRPEGCVEWRQAINQTGADELIVAWDRLTPGQEQLPPEAAWVASDPAATPIGRGGGAATFSVNGDLDPGACR